LGRFARETGALLRQIDAYRGHVPSSGAQTAFAQMAAVRKIQAATGVLPNYEGLLAHQFCQVVKRGDVVFDIGAHAGLHTRRLLGAVGDTGKVVAFEPLPEQFAALTAEFGGRGNVTLHQMALGKSTGRASFVHAVGAPEESGLIERVYNRPEATQPTTIDVQVGRLDDVAASFDRIDFIKIDIEGGEIDCLSGGERTLERCRPVISVEYGFPAYSRYGWKPETLFDFAKSRRYGVFDLFGNELSERGDWLRFCDQMYWDYFLVPNERAEAREELTRPS
jgi:FkbM family methyltransferase